MPLRTKVLVTMAIGAALVSIAVPARAKGFEHSTITVRGPGLSAPIHLRGEDAVAYLSDAGFGEVKWSTPNIGGSLDPDAKLGPAYAAVIDMRCGGGNPSELRQTLYPYAPGGLQILSSDGRSRCFGDVRPGYWPASQELLNTLLAKGLPAAPPADVQAASSRDRVAIASSDSGASGSTIALVAAAVVLAIGGLWVLVRRRTHA